ncbi:acyl-CoA N-acyltransferase [Hypoxylon sp. NC1633]|nr:acyl-CoA N-acyltransferase [Hypoxylon sp. NC1633]
MSFQIRKATPSDIPGIIDTYFDAFGGHPITRRLFFPRSEAVQAYWLNLLSNELQNPNIYFVIMVEPSPTVPDRVLAFSKWWGPLTQTPPSSLSPTSLPEGADEAFAEEVLGLIDRKHEEIMGGRPHWYLEMLGVKEDFQRKGAGTQLLKWGLGKADDAEVEAYLTASPAGAPLYKKYGFKLLESIPIDNGSRIENFMLRPAKKS